MALCLTPLLRLLESPLSVLVPLLKEFHALLVRKFYKLLFLKKVLNDSDVRIKNRKIKYFVRGSQILFRKFITLPFNIIAASTNGFTLSIKSSTIMAILPPTSPTTLMGGFSFIVRGGRETAVPTSVMRRLLCDDGEGVDRSSKSSSSFFSSPWITAI